VIIGYGDQTVRDIDDLHRLLVEEKVGIPMTLTFLRRGEKRTILVNAEESRVQDQMSAP
jgi:S1-C subfamily serine protease